METKVIDWKLVIYLKEINKRGHHSKNATPHSQTHNIYEWKKLRDRSRYPFPNIQSTKSIKSNFCDSELAVYLTDQR